MHPDDPTFRLQQELAGRYSFERELGRGGMGTVHLAREVALDRTVAIKVLHPELAARADQRERFLREARTAARLVHPNVVPIFAVGESEYGAWFAMGHVDGESLQAQIHRDGPLPPSRALQVIRDVGQALALAHAHGVAHRDITLDNIMIERGTNRAVLLDFGIAAEFDAGDATHLVGTPAYLAPELIQGSAPDARSDLYALGIAAWTMLTGRLPFADHDVARTLVRQMTEAPAPLANAAANTPGRMRRAIEAALAKDPSERPRDVESWLRSMADDAPVTTLATPLQHWVERGQGVRMIYAGVMMITAVKLHVFGWTYGTATERVVALFTPFLAMLPFALLAHAWVEGRYLRAAAAAGYRIEDIRLALQRHASQRARDAEPPSLFARTVRNVVVVALLVWIGAAIADALTSSWHGALHPRDFYRAFAPLRRFIFDVSRWSATLFWTSLAFWAAAPVFHRGKGIAASLSRRFWQSSVGAFAMRVAGLGTRRAEAPVETLHRPTELVLDLMIRDLWQALPSSERELVLQLPAVAESLRERAEALKALQRQLDASRPSEQVELAAVRRSVDERHRAAISALESLRLKLLTLSGIKLEASAFTEELRIAETVDHEILREFGAHPSLARIAGRKREQLPGATPSPAYS